MFKGRPVKTFVNGDHSVSIWLNEDGNRDWWTVTYVKRYIRDVDRGKTVWGYTQTMTKQDVQQHNALMGQAWDWMVEADE